MLVSHCHYRAVFNWAVKAIRVYFGFALLRAVIDCRESRHFLSQWEEKSKPIVICTPAFSRAWYRLHVISLNCDRLLTLFPACYWFWFDDTQFKPALTGLFNCVGLLSNRSCDTFLPHIFQFLVLLSYECFQPKFNEPKAIVGMPRIIQLCDGIMAGGQPAQTHGMVKNFVH